MVYPVLLAPDYVPELHVVTQTEDGEFQSSNSCCVVASDLKTLPDFLVFL